MRWGNTRYLSLGADRSEGYFYDNMLQIVYYFIVYTICNNIYTIRKITN